MGILDILSGMQPPEKREVTPIGLSTLGHKAAEEFIGNNLPLNDSITKIAAAHNLNNEQIRRVCEIANVTAFNLLFEKTASKTFEFPLANADEILASRNEADMPKVASAKIDKISHPKSWMQDKDLDNVLSMFEGDDLDTKERLYKTASISIAQNEQRLERIEESIEDEVTFKKIAASNAIADLKTSVKEYILNDGNPGLVLAIAQMKGIRPIMEEIFADIEEASMKSVDHWDRPEEKVIDPSHPIIVKMDTVKSCMREHQKATTAADMYADKVKYIRKEVHGD